MKRILVMLVALFAISTLYSEWIVDESFESGSIPGDWTIYNGDEGSTWSAYESEDYAYGGSWSAFTDSYYPENEDNWLILPQTEISAGDSVSMYIRSWYSTEDFELLVSVESNAINDFDDELISVEGQGTDYTQYIFDLSEYAGQSIYVGIHWMCDTYGLLADNVKLGQGEVIEPEMDLPDNFTFEQGTVLSVDFSDYITNAVPESSQLSVSGNEQVDVVVEGFLVTFSCLNWYGSDEMIFTLEDDQGNSVNDVVQVIVQAAEVYDLIMVTISTPGILTCLNEAVLPCGIISNGGNTESGYLSLEIYCEISDDAGELVYSSLQESAFSLQPGEELEVVFTEPWETAFEGDYTVDIGFDLEDASEENNSFSMITQVREHFGSGGPDDFGYRWLDNHEAEGPQYNWIDISETGISAITYNVSGFAGDDNFSEPLPFGFEFNFYGISYDEFYVDTNGEILLAENTWYEPYPSTGWDNDGNVFNWVYPIPGYGQMPALIAAYWDDLEADEGIGDIYFQTFGEAPERYCVIEWHDFRFHSGEGIENLLNFEAIIYENGEILLQYAETFTGQTGTNAPHDYGQSATVAIQNEAADLGLCYLQEQVEGGSWIGVEPEGNILTNGLAIRFFAGEDILPPFFSFDEIGNTINQTIELEVSITDMSGLSEDHLVYDTGNGWETISHTSFIEPDRYIYELNNLEAGSEVHYYFSAVDASELANEGTIPENAPEEFFSFKVLPFDNNMVLLAYSGYQDYTGSELNVWRETLNSMDIPYDEYNWQEWQQVVIPDQYSAVYLYSSSCSHSEELDSLCVALMDWLDSGTENDPKNLFMSSDGFAYSQSGHPNSSPMKKLWNAYFRTSYVATGYGGGTNGLGGPENLYYEEGSFQVLTGSPLGFGGEEIEVYANSPDCIFRYEACPSWYEDEVINPEIGAHNAFIFEDGPFNGQAYLYHGVCGTWIDDLIYKAFYFSFDLSQITSADDRSRIILDSADWFDIQVDEQPDEVIPAITELRQNYPNPFVIENNKRNNLTVFSFTCTNAQKAELSIYDIRGRKIRNFTEQLEPGLCEYSISWDGLDKQDKEVSSGIYLYQLKLDGSFSGAKKLILIR